ncbi:Nn.00g034360.m01.CDS01 [Neocucurbitaria sp. VM-36]
MPLFTIKKPEDANDFSWDAFPPPPPEAENWQPDPNSVAKPGDLPDPRFGRDPYEDVRRETYKKDAKTYSIPADVAASLKSGSSSLAVGGVNPARLHHGPCPDLAPQDSRSPQELIHEANPPPSMYSIGSRADTTNSLYNAPSNSYTSSTDQVATLAKGTMETFPFTEFHQPQSSASSDASAKLVSLPKNAVPAWAAPLEKALAEEIRGAPTNPAKGTTQSVKTASASIPPHLRKTRRLTSGTAGPHLNPTAKIYKPSKSHQSETSCHAIGTTAAVTVATEEDRLRDETLAWKMATIDLGLDDAKQGLELQAKMLSEYSGNSPDPTALPTTVTTSNRCPKNHGHWIKTRMVLIMEDDLDLSRRATKRELMAMTDDDIDRYLVKVSSAHQHWWEAEQRYRLDEANLSE